MSVAIKPAESRLITLGLGELDQGKLYRIVSGRPAWLGAIVMGLGVGGIDAVTIAPSDGQAPDPGTTWRCGDNDDRDCRFVPVTLTGEITEGH